MNETTYQDEYQVDRPARLTKKQTNELMATLRHLERARAYLFAPHIAIAHKGTKATTSLHYVKPGDGSTLFEVEKAYGSDLTGLDMGIQSLRTFLGYRDGKGGTSYYAPKD